MDTLLIFLQIIQGTNLKILGSVELDSGIYQCVATNPVGNVQTAAQLKVLKKGISFINDVHILNHTMNMVRTYFVYKTYWKLEIITKLFEYTIWILNLFVTMVVTSQRLN